MNETAPTKTVTSETPPSESDPETMAGQAVYTPSVLKIYDTLVLRISNPFIWRCRTGHLTKWYQTHASANHLDVGVGTGYFPDRCRFPVENPRVGLMDLNPHCLQAAAERIARYQPETYQRDILRPIDFDAAPFDSIAVNYVLHCLPGTIPEKARMFDHLLPLLRPGGVIFGSTLLTYGVKRNFAARKLMAKYNQTKAFCNAADSLDELRAELASRFVDPEIRVIGCAALFVGRKKAATA